MCGAHNSVALHLIDVLGLKKICYDNLSSIVQNCGTTRSRFVSIQLYFLGFYKSFATGDCSIGLPWMHTVKIPLQLICVHPSRSHNNIILVCSSRLNDMTTCKRETTLMYHWFPDFLKSHVCVRLDSLQYVAVTASSKVYPEEGKSSEF
jgi:hypothetical protein